MIAVISTCSFILTLTTVSPTVSAGDFTNWGRQTLATIERDHRMGSGGYFEDQTRQKPAFAWGNAILLLAYAKAAKVDHRYARPLDELVQHLEYYWVEDKGIWGYDCLPTPRPKVERFYDDNAWIVMGLIDAYDATAKNDYLLRAEKTLAFCLSGIDPNDGGVWWKETWDSDRRRTKNTCSVAPIAFSCLRFYEVTKKESYLSTAKALLVWLDANLRDEDSLYFDNIRVSGRLGRKKWSYNSAMPLRCYVLLYELSGKDVYLENAAATAKAAEAYWYDATGALKCEAMFAFTLVEAWLELAAATKDERWRALAESTMLYVHQNVQDKSGRYAKRWDSAVAEPLTRWNLLYPAAAARAYWSLADECMTLTSPK